LGSIIHKRKLRAMKTGMNLVKSTEVSDGYIVMGFSNGFEKEWATYYSKDSDPKNTVWGRYFLNLDEAEANFKSRVERGF